MAPKPGYELRGGWTEKKEEEKEKFPLCESIGHRPLRGRCPKGMIMGLTLVLIMGLTGINFVTDSGIN